ncbi:MAG: indolepyruvate ferredoxin oxidoreductase family protein [Acidimicrobiales bacterium]|jgi:indolepyruvate ferredoxin oxidoreductase|nr:indolepyruvate ferredoxin oxidoreductase family protein [Acidimicrobiales bacterium]
MALADFKLEDRFTRSEGDVAMSGVQALLRVLLDQLRADKRDGFNNAAMVSGYRGSPLGGIDSLMLGNAEELADNNIQFVPGLNEDLGATTVWGSQLANRNFDGKFDGVLGMWYGKAPGVDRSGDAIRHANVCGVDPKGGVLLVAGDDPASKSSTLASESEFALLHFQTPILYPGTVQEVADYGRIGYELSRYSGLWVALKIVTNVADGYSTIKVGPGRVQMERPDFEWDGVPWQHTQQDALFGPFAVRQELEIHEGRMEATDAFTRLNSLDTVSGATSDARIGFVAAGKTYYDLREALDRMGLDEAELKRRGVRLYKPAVVWPLEANGVRQFASGLETIVVVEEKRAFIETFMREILYGSTDAPTILGKRDAENTFWFPGHGEMDADLIARKIRPFLVNRLGEDAVGPAVRERVTIPVALGEPDTKKQSNRTPNFCSGCPHNRSTWVPEGSEAGGGIGCHGMASMTPTRNVKGTTQMGGEGVQWVGAAPFVTMEHRFQNIGDGTFHHSGSLAVRQAVAAGTNVTYKILYNAAVAMTGGQDVDGGMTVPELTRSLEAEGVTKVMVLTHDTEKYGEEAHFADGTEVWYRDRLDEAQRILRDTPGCTVLIYDQPCAAELRRDRKRGKVAEPTMAVFINEAVCEGCGDCGEKSSCLSVQPVETEFGRKTAIHQSSCNKDFTCLDGDCPAFIEVVAAGVVPEKSALAVAEIGDDQSEPDRLDEGNVLMIGIGGTGVVTVNQLLATAALLDGKEAHGLDQTGLAQKGGPVVSNLKIRRPDSELELGEANKIATGEADAYIVFDLLSGTNPANLEKAMPGRTVALVSSSKVPTGAMVRDTSAEYPEWSALQASIDSATVAEKNVYYDAGNLSDNLFRSHMPANIIVLGSAYQSGVVPISAAAIERAIELNGVAVEMNTQAFRIGRQIVIEPEFIDKLGIERVGKVNRKNNVSEAFEALIQSVPDPSEELERLLRIRVPDLVDYQNTKYAKTYVERVSAVRAVEATVGQDTRLSETYARYLYKLMAYKDEYEVARLHRSKAFQQAVRDQFGDRTKVTYKLHPPSMRRLGLDQKIGLSRAGDLAFGILRRMKFLRGTPLDIFGNTTHRKMERGLVEEYQTMIDSVMVGLGPDSYDKALRVAELPDIVRGYEGIKEANVERFRQAANEILS